MPPSISRGSSVRGRQSLALERNPSINSHHEGPFGGLRKALTGGTTLRGSVISKNKTRKGSKSSKAGNSALPAAQAQSSDLHFPINEHQSYNHHHDYHATAYSMDPNDGQKHNGKSARAEAANFFGVFLSLLRWKKKLLLKTKGKEEPMMACPFFRLDPFRYQRCFGKYELRRFSDVKQHLERCHSPGSYYCDRCQTRWSKKEHWAEHLNKGCSGPPLAPDLDKIPLDKLERLKRMPRGASDDKKYRIMWETFFPGPCPDPFLRDLPTEAASQLRQFQELSLRQNVIPALLQKHGVVLDARKTQDLAEEILAEAYNPKHARTPAPIYRDPAVSKSLLPAASASPRPDDSGTFASGGNNNNYISNDQLLHQSPEQLQQGFQQQPRIKPELSIDCDMEAIQYHQPQPHSLMEPMSAHSHSMVHSPTVSIGEGLHQVDSVDGATMNSAGGFHHHLSQPSVDSYLSPSIQQLGPFCQPFDNVSPTTVNLPILGGPSSSGGPPSLASEPAPSFTNDWLPISLDGLDGGDTPMKLDDFPDDFSQPFGLQPMDATPNIMVYPPAANLSFPKCGSCLNGMDYQYCHCQSYVSS